MSVQISAKDRRFRPRTWVPGWDIMEYAFLRVVAAALNLLPAGFACWLGDVAGDAAFLVLRKRRAIALHNLDLAYGDSKSKSEKTRIARLSFRHMTLSFLELFRVPAFLSEVKQAIRIEGADILARAFQKGKGVIFVFSHLGSWEYGSFSAYLLGYTISAVVRPLRNAHIYKWVQALRERMRLHPIDKDHAIRRVLKELRANHVVVILIDQWAGDEGIRCDFFGHPTSTTDVPARLAKSTGAALVPLYCLRTGCGRYTLAIKPEVPLEGGAEDWRERTTQKLNDLLEQMIRSCPDQWTWVHRRWKDLPQTL
jgi:KDO2-lipid IV(A) lauroyltransferase